MPLNDATIKSLMKINSRKSSFYKEIKKGYIKKQYQSNYESFLKTNDWNLLKAKWEELIPHFESEFDKKVKMKIFDYENGEIDTLMTPIDSVRYHNQHLQGSLMSASTMGPSRPGQVATKQSWPYKSTQNSYSMRWRMSSAGVKRASVIKEIPLARVPREARLVGDVWPNRYRSVASSRRAVCSIRNSLQPSRGSWVARLWSVLPHTLQRCV